MAVPSQRAQPPHPPSPSRALDRARQAAESYRHGRARVERASVVRGILIIAFAILVFSIARAGHGRALIPGWWRW